MPTAQENDQAVDQVDDESDAAFDAGFTGAEIDLTETPKVEEVTPEPEVKYAQITEDELNSLRTKVASIEGMRDETQRKIDGAFGKIGNLQQVIERLQSSTPDGSKVEITEEDMKEISEQYPDLSKSMLKTLQNVVGKLKGTGGNAAPFDLSSIDQRVQQQLQPQVESLRVQIQNEIAAEELAESFPNWREIAGAPGSNTEFRQWLAKQPDNRADKVLNSSRASVISKALADFTASKKAPAAKPNNRENRLKAAITPRGEGAVTQSVGDDDDFTAGFNSVKRM